MAPESQNPGTQAGSDKFVDGHHPTDGVRAFKHGELADVAPMLQVPDSPGVIDHATLETEVNKIPLDRKTDKKRMTSVVAGVVGAVVLGGIGYAGYRVTQGDEPTRETTSASPAPQGNESNPNTPEEQPAAMEVVASVEQYPTAADAIEPLRVRIDEYKNYYGTADNLRSTPLSEAQKAEHEQMLRDVFGDNLDNPATPELAGFITNLREAWSEIFGYKALTQLSMDSGYAPGLFELTSAVTDIQPVGESQVRFTLVPDANFEENGLDENMDPAYAASIEHEITILATLEQVDGAWYIANWQNG